MTDWCCVSVFSKTCFPPFISKVSHDTLGVSRGAPGIAPVSWWWHLSRRRGGGVKGEVLTPGLEPTTPGSPEESLATTGRLFPPEEGKSMEHTPSARAQGYKWDGTEES